MVVALIVNVIFIKALEHFENINGLVNLVFCIFVLFFFFFFFANAFKLSVLYCLKSSTFSRF